MTKYHWLLHKIVNRSWCLHYNLVNLCHRYYNSPHNEKRFHRAEWKRDLTKKVLFSKFVRKFRQIFYLERRSVNKNAWGGMSEESIDRCSLRRYEAKNRKKKESMKCLIFAYAHFCHNGLSDKICRFFIHTMLYNFFLKVGVLD